MENDVSEGHAASDLIMKFYDIGNAPFPVLVWKWYSFLGTGLDLKIYRFGENEVLVFN